MKKACILILFLASLMAWGQEGIELPMFKGGQQAYIDFISKEMVYPRHAVELRIEGRVFLEFFVEEDGSVTDVKLIQGIGGGCNEEAMRVIGLTSGMWFPCRDNGEPVRVLYKASIQFGLREEPLSYTSEFNKGVDFMRIEEYEQAIKAFDMAVQIEENCNKCIYSRGMSYFLLKDYKNAIHDWEIVYKRNYNKKDVSPKLTEAYLKIGNDYLSQKKHNIAVVIYDKALIYSPNEMSVLNNQANAYFYMGDKVKACQDWRKMKELGSEEVDLQLEAYCK